MNVHLNDISSAAEPSVTKLGMVMHHHIKFGYQKISSLADMVETVIYDYMSPHCDPELEDSKPIFLHDTLAHDLASPYQI